MCLNPGLVSGQYQRLKTVKTAVIVLLVCLVFSAGCGKTSDDAFYKKAVTYEETAYMLSRKAIDNGSYTPETLKEIRNKAAVEAGFASEKEAGAELREYMDSDESAKKEIAQKVIETAMDYASKIEQYRKQHSPGKIK